MLLTVPLVWGLARLLRGDAEQPGIWVVGVAAALAATVAAASCSRPDRPRSRSTDRVGMDVEEYVERVLQCVESVPRGRVTTYGAIAEVVGAVMGGGGPRQVGWSWRRTADR